MNQTPKHILFFFLVLGMVAGVSGAAAVFSQRQMRLRGALNGLPDPDLPYRVPLMGVNADLTQYDEDELDGHLDLMADAGFVWLRQRFDWGAIEPQQGQYEWATWDAVFETIAEHPADLRIVAVLTGSPDWAADEPGTRPFEPGDFGAFAAAFAERYGEDVDVYEIWDEPNLSASWGHPVDPIGYAELLREAYVAIHQNDPNEVAVLTGGLAPTTDETLDAYSDLLYLRDLYVAGIRFYHDGVAAKATDPGLGLNDRRANADLLNFHRLLLLREEMEAHGDKGRPLWVTSFTFEAEPDQQAAWTAGAYEQAAYEWPWAGALIVDSWQAEKSNDGTGLLNAEGQPRPAYEALRQVGTSLKEAAYPGVYPASSPHIEYEGEWVITPLGTNIRGPGRIGYITLPFYGSEAAVIARRPRHSTYMYVEVDGEPSRALPHNERGAFIVVTSADLVPTVDMQPLATGLDPTERHVVRMEHERTWVPWLVVGFAVGNHIPTLGYDLGIAGSVLLALVSAWGTWRIGQGIDFGSFGRRVEVLYGRLGDTAQLAITLVAGLAVWIGLAITWGGTLTNVTRRLDDGPTLAITLLTAGVYYFSPSLLLTLAALVALFILIYLRLDLGLLLVVLFAPLYLLPRPLYDRYFTLVEIVLLLCFAAWIIKQVASWREKAPPTPMYLWQVMTGLDKAALLFVAISLFSLLVADIKGVAATELRTVILEPALFYVMLRTVKLPRRAIWRLVDGWVMTGIIVSLVGLYEFTTGIDIVAAEEGVERLRSVYGSPNNVGLYLGRILPLTLAIGLTARASGGRRLLYAGGGLLMLVAVGLSLSKGALLLGLPAGLGLVLVVLGGRWGRIATGLAYIAGAATLIPLSQHPRFEGLLNFSEGTTGFRLMLWRSSLKMIRDHPIFGVGLDNFLYQYRGAYILPEAWFEPNLSHPHNVVLDYWVRLGIIGLAAGAWLQVAFWRQAWRLQKRLVQSDAALRAVVVGLMGGMADYLAHGLVDNSYFVIDLAFAFFLTLGILHQIGTLTGETAP